MKTLRLADVDLSLAFDDKESYEKALAAVQLRLLRLQIKTFNKKRRAIIVCEGRDAAGKGGAIKRMTEKIDPRGVRVWPIGPPHVDEQARHYLYRFWERVPPPGTWTIFDRSWYGRVLVERIEDFCSKQEWKRAYREINEFERQLTDDGVRLVKLLVHVSEEEQKKRMIERLRKPYKRYKVGLEDFRNIAKRKQYLEAYKDMLDKTDTDYAPWNVIASDNKDMARLAGLKIVADTIGRGLDITEHELDPEIAKAAFKLWGWKPDAEKNQKKKKQDGKSK